MKPFQSLEVEEDMSKETQVGKGVLENIGVMGRKEEEED